MGIDTANAVWMDVALLQKIRAQVPCDEVTGHSGANWMNASGWWYVIKRAGKSDVKVFFSNFPSPNITFITPVILNIIASEVAIADGLT